MAKNIFGSDGSRYYTSGTATYSHKNGRSPYINKVENSNTTFGGDWCRNDIGDTSYLSSGKTINRAGDTYFCEGKTYNVRGNTLFCSDGKTWSSTGGFTDSEVRDIISNNEW